MAIDEAEQRIRFGRCMRISPTIPTGVRSALAAVGHLAEGLDDLIADFT
jgi:hypothetical protein